MMALKQRFAFLVPFPGLYPNWSSDKFSQ